MVNPDYNNAPIDQMGLSTRSRNALKRAGYRTVGDIMNLTVLDILDLPNLGISSLSDILQQAEKAGLLDRVTALEDTVGKLVESVGIETMNIADLIREARGET